MRATRGDKGTAVQVIGFGFLSLFCAIVAIVLKLRKNNVFSIVTGLLALVFITVSLYFWFLILINSGKNVRFLGFDLYPPVGVIVLFIIAIGISCITTGIVGLVRKRRGGVSEMRMFLKGMVAIATLAVGWLMGIYLLDYSKMWTIMAFGIVCYGVGHGTYWVLRRIDKRYPKS